MVSLKLAEVALLSDELCMVVFAEEFAFMRNVVRRTYCATTVGAFEAAFVVRSSIHTHLLSWVYGILATEAFLSRSGKHARDFSRSRFLAAQRSFWFDNFRDTFKAFLKAASSLENLIEVWPAVENSFKGIVVRKLEGALAVVTPEAGLVVNAVVGGQLVDQVHRLVARHALLGRPRESHDPLYCSRPNTAGVSLSCVCVRLKISCAKQKANEGADDKARERQKEKGKKDESRFAG